MTARLICKIKGNKHMNYNGLMKKYIQHVALNLLSDIQPTKIILEGHHRKDPAASII